MFALFSFAGSWSALFFYSYKLFILNWWFRTFLFFLLLARRSLCFNCTVWLEQTHGARANRPSIISVYMFTVHTTVVQCNRSENTLDFFSVSLVFSHHARAKHLIHNQPKNKRLKYFSITTQTHTTRKRWLEYIKKSSRLFLNRNCTAWESVGA